MLDLSQAIGDLKKTADFTPQYMKEAFTEVLEEFHELLNRFTKINNLSTFLEFLRLTGRAHISNKIFSLGIYGFSGMVVPAFAEVSLIDLEHYFVVGEVLYVRSKAQFYFAFDLRLKKDQVYIAGDDDADYRLCSSSFVELLERFARGDYPGIK